LIYNINYRTKFGNYEKILAFSQFKRRTKLFSANNQPELYWNSLAKRCYDVFISKLISAQFISKICADLFRSKIRKNYHNQPSAFNAHTHLVQGRTGFLTKSEAFSKIL
jgi:hypothetical protein